MQLPSDPLPTVVGLVRQGHMAEAKEAVLAAPLTSATKMDLLVLLAERGHDCGGLKAAIPSVPSIAEGKLQRISWAFLDTCPLPTAEEVVETACRVVHDARSCAWMPAAGATDGRPVFLLSGAEAGAMDLWPDAVIPVVNLSINGCDPQPFFIDTGVGTTVVNASYADGFGITYDRSLPTDVRNPLGEDVSAFPFLGSTVDLGGVRVEGFTGVVMALPSYFKVAGLLNPVDTLRTNGVEFNFRNHRLRIVPHEDPAVWKSSVDEPWVELPLVWAQGRPFVHARLDGHDGWFLIDTGSSNSTVSPEMSIVLGHVPDAASVQGQGDGRVAVYPTFLGTVAVGDTVPQTMEWKVRPKFEDATVPPFVNDGTLGANWMSGRRIYFPVGGGSVMLTNAVVSP